MVVGLISMVGQEVYWLGLRKEKAGLFDGLFVVSAKVGAVSLSISEILLNIGWHKKETTARAS